MHDAANETEKSLAAALGHVPSGLFILTARHGSNETGMLASWVQQCSFQPPQVTVAVNKERFILEWLADGMPFTINVISEGQINLKKHFGRGFAPGEPAFHGLEVTHTGTGAAILKEAHAYLDCRVAARVDAGDHVLVIGEVVGGAVLHEGKPSVHVRKRAWSDGGMPSISAITVVGRGAAKSAQRSHSPRSAMRSTVARASSRTCASIAAMRLGGEPITTEAAIHPTLSFPRRNSDATMRVVRVRRRLLRVEKVRGHNA